jgi:hypothetical protein
MMASTSFELSSMDTSSAAYRRRKNADGANDDDARENPVKHHNCIWPGCRVNPSTRTFYLARWDRSQNYINYYNIIYYYLHVRRVATVP